MKKLKITVEDLSRQNNDLNGLKARLTQENFDLQVRRRRWKKEFRKISEATTK